MSEIFNFRYECCTYSSHFQGSVSGVMMGVGNCEVPTNSVKHSHRFIIISHEKAPVLSHYHIWYQQKMHGAQDATIVFRRSRSRSLVTWVSETQNFCPHIRVLTGDCLCEMRCILYFVYTAKAYGNIFIGLRAGFRWTVMYSSKYYYLLKRSGSNALYIKLSLCTKQY